MSTCPNCGGTILGDGYTTPLHCENVDITLSSNEPDCKSIYCTGDNDEE